MWLQIVGKTRLALSPKQNHWWHVPLYVSSRGSTTSPIPYGLRSFEVEDYRHAAYDAAQVNRFFRVLLQADRITKRFQGRFLGKRPEPPGLASTSIRPAAAYYSRELADFILPYEAARSASSPDDAVLDFYQSAYTAGADLARWDRAGLDRPPRESS